MNILFLDKEGGYGGSSRSLFLLIKYLDRKALHPLVISNEEGPIADRYAQINVNHLTHKIPILKPAKRKNSFILLRFIAAFVSFLQAARYLSAILKRHKIEIIHFNHDGYFPYAVVNKLWWRRKIIFHMRTMLPVNWLARLQAWIIKACSDHLLFISPNERERFFQMVDPSVSHGILSNIAEKGLPEESERPAWLTQFDGRFKVLILSILATSKGIDRVIDIAKEFKKNHWTSPVLLVCGSERNHATNGRGTLKSQILEQLAGEALNPYVYFADFQPNPEGIMNHADAVLRLSRENDPWGRDIIEAITNGKPVLATGDNPTYVEQDTNGYLFEPYDPQAIAERIFFLSQNKQACEKIREANLKKGHELFNGQKIARQVESTYFSLSNSKKSPIKLEETL